MIDAGGFLGGTHQMTPGSGQTLRWRYGTDPGAGCSTEPGTGSNVTMSWSITDKWWALAGVCLKPQPGGGNQAIWCMSKIYDRIQESRKKVGVGNFGISDGLWKPKTGLATI